MYSTNSQTMKRKNTFLNLLYIVLSLVLFINIFLSPYPKELTILGIQTEVNKDAVLVALLMNIIVFVVLILVWIYLLRNRNKKNKYFLMIITLVNIIIIIYWLRYI